VAYGAILSMMIPLYSRLMAIIKRPIASQQESNNFSVRTTNTTRGTNYTSFVGYRCVVDSICSFSVQLVRIVGGLPN